MVKVVTLSEGFVREDVVSVVLDAVHPKNLHHGVAEAAPGGIRNPFHEHHHFVAVHQFLDGVVVGRRAEIPADDLRTHKAPRCRC